MRAQLTKLQEGQMDVRPVLDLQAPEAIEPGERPFDHPAVNTTEISRRSAPRKAPP
jgi:hypothetical protein